MAWFSVMASWVTRGHAVEPAAGGFLLGEFHEGTAEPAALSAGIYGDVLDIQVVVAGAEGEHGRDGRACDPGRAGFDGWPVVAEHRGGRFVHPRQVPGIRGVDDRPDRGQVVRGRTRSPGGPGVLSDDVVVIGRPHGLEHRGAGDFTENDGCWVGRGPWVRTAVGLSSTDRYREARCGRRSLRRVIGARLGRRAHCRRYGRQSGRQHD
jgi:hypothetical protein